MPVSFPIDLGLTGHVARTGETLNLKEGAYQDERFSTAVDWHISSSLKLHTISLTSR